LIAFAKVARSFRSNIGHLRPDILGQEGKLADLFVNESKKWKAVAETVQGQQSSSSCALSDGRIVFSARPVSKSAKPNLKLLSQILRSDEPLPPVARKWLADLFDPDSDSDYHVETLVRRSQGAKPAGPTHNWEAARHAHDLMRWGEDKRELKAQGETWEKWNRAVFLTATEFNTTKSTVERAIKSYREALRKSTD